jgi:phosphoribosylformylglycinamidine synthase
MRTFPKKGLVNTATFSPLESGISSSVVQIGHAIVEKKFLDVLLVARNKRLYRSITDCGAGGFSSAIGELGSTTGVRVTLENAPLKYPGLAPWEIWLSESQERMVLAVPPENWNSLKTLFQLEDVEAVVIGEFTNDRKLTITYNGAVLADMEMDFLHDGLPKMKLEATWDAKTHEQRHFTPNNAATKINRADISTTLKTLLAHPVIASKQSIVRQYDHEVQGGSVIKPFMGVGHDAPTDGCVFRPKLGSWRAVVLSNGMNPEIGKFDPYVMAKTAVDEAYRNMIAVGGGLLHAAILDNFCWGDAKSPQELAGLVRAAFRVVVIFV